MIEREKKKRENKKIMKKEIITPNSENSLATTQRLVMIQKWLITPKYKSGYLGSNIHNLKNSTIKIIVEKKVNKKIFKISYPHSLGPAKVFIICKFQFRGLIIKCLMSCA